MFRANILAACWITMAGLAAGVAVEPLAAAQSQARAKPAVTYSTSRGYLGIGVLDITDERARALGLKEPQGVEVTSVSEDTPAAKAGLKTGDVILEYNGQRVEGGAQFIRMVQETPAGRKVEMQVWRNGAKQAVTATLSPRQERTFAFTIPNTPFPPEMPVMPDTPHDMFSWRSTFLGVETESLNSQLAEYFGVKEGVLVRSVLKGSSAETAGLKAGDIITKIENETVSSPRNVTQLLRKAGKNVTLTVVRNHSTITLNVKLSQLQRDDLQQFFGVQPREIL